MEPMPNLDAASDPTYDTRHYEHKKGDDTWSLHVHMKRKSGNNNLVDRLNSIASENFVSENKYKKVNNNTKTVGMIFYMESGYAENAEDNELIHIPYASNPSIYPELIALFVKDYLKKDVHQIVCGHEHGDRNKKCHLQTAIVFEDKLTQIMNPGKLIVQKNGQDVVSMLFMQQSTRNSFKLKEYCKKEGDYTLLNQDLEIKVYTNRKNEMDVYKTIVENKEKLTKEEALELLQHKTSRDYFVCNANISKAIDSLVSEPLPAFEWVLPKHLNKFDIPCGNMRVPFWPLFMEWFENNCLADKPRKVALCLYSSQRGLGKTLFARSLVNHHGYILEYNNTFTSRHLNSNDKYKLLLLDDMKDITPANEQMWRSLVASQKTTIRDAYCNENYELCLPCIITTNSSKLLMKFVKDPLFYTQVISIEIDKYMGPENTFDPLLYKKKVFISVNASTKVNDEEEILNNKKETIFQILKKIKDN